MSPDLLRSVVERMGWTQDKYGDWCSWEGATYTFVCHARGDLTPAGTLAVLLWLLARDYMIWKEGDKYMVRKKGMFELEFLQSEFEEALCQAVVAYISPTDATD